MSIMTHHALIFADTICKLDCRHWARNRGSTMTHKTIAWLEDEIAMLVHEIDKLAERVDVRLAKSSAMLVADIVSEEADRMLQSLLARRAKKARKQRALSRNA